VKESCLRSVLSKYVGPEKIVCFPSGKMGKVVHFCTLYLYLFFFILMMHT